MLKGRIIVLVGPSGSGKTTIGDILTEYGIKKLITTTTRKPREGEKDGVDYYFRNADKLNPDDFIEQTTYNGNIYGLTKEEVGRSLEKNNQVHVSLDKSGAKILKETFPEETVVFFISVTLEAMLKRMEKRGDSREKIEERIAFCQSTGELSPPKETDFVVNNIDLSKTAEEILTKLKNVRA